MNKKILGFCLVLFTPVSVSADIVITEIMYDLEGSDSKREWVEFVNDSDTTFNLEGLLFHDGSNHALNEPPKNGGTGDYFIDPQEVFILSSDATTVGDEYPNFDGTIIDTVMSLANTGDTISLRNTEGEILTTANYVSDLGASGDGNSLQLENNEFVTKTPSFGLWEPLDQNEEEVLGGEEIVEEDKQELGPAPFIPDFSAYINVPNQTVTGSLVLFEGYGILESGDDLGVNARYIWLSLIHI